jgi:hypothetical protein
MFKLQSLETPIRWPVRVSIPRDGGVASKVTFHASFRVLPQDRLDELASASDADWAEAIVAGWDGVADEDGATIEFSPEALARMVQIVYVREAIRLAYFDCMNGRAVKN